MSTDHTVEGHLPLDETLVVRVVPISSSQLRALESIERAFFGLAADFQRDFGLDGDGEIAGGLYRIWSTLGMITTTWKEGADELSRVEGWRLALQRIRDGADDPAQLAAKALQ